jgi:hypothetical protein
MYKCLLSFIKLSMNFEHPTNFTIFNKIQQNGAKQRPHKSFHL